jgi:multiple sugar transport system substrate-binding protein
MNTIQHHLNKYWALAVLASLILSACAGAATPVATTPEAKSPTSTPLVVRETVQVEKVVTPKPTVREPVTLRFQHWGSPEEQKLYELWAGQFHEKYPWITLQIEAVPVNDYFDKLLPNVAAGTSPDVIRDNATGQAGIFTKFYIPLDQFISDPVYGINKTDYLDSTWFYCEDGGKTYCLPTDFIAFSLYYNKKIFDDAGIPYPSDDWTWSQFVDAANKLTRDVNNDGVMDTCGFWADPNYVDPWYVWLMNAGGSIVNSDQTQVMFNDQAGKDALQLYVNAVKCWQVGAGAQGAGSADFSFNSGNVAMFVSGPWERPGLDAIKDRGWDYGVARLPKNPDHPRANIAAGGTIGVSPNSKHPFEAYLWARWFVEYPQQSFAGGLGWSFPTLKSALLDVLPKRADNMPFWEDAQNNQIDKMYFSKYNDIAPVIREMLQDALVNGNKPGFDIQSLLDQYSKEADDVLNQ